MKTSMQIDSETLKELDKIKIHPRQTYEEVVLELLKKVEK